MDIKFPVRLDNNMIVNSDDEPFRLDEGQKFNGYDANNNRITNVIGFDGEYLLKWCPNCKEVHLSIDFGPMGRPATDGRRDQSWCQVCRARD